MSDRLRVLDRLRRGPVHSIEIRRSGLSGNPSERIRELEAEGYRIRHELQPWTDGEGKSRRGTLYTLISEPTDETGGAPVAPPDHAAGLVGEAHDRSALTVKATGDSARVAPAAEPANAERPREGQDSLGTLFEVPAPPARPSYADPEAA